METGFPIWSPGCSSRMDLMPCADQSAHPRTTARDYSSPATRIILSLRDSGVTAVLSRKAQDVPPAESSRVPGLRAVQRIYGGPAGLRIDGYALSGVIGWVDLSLSPSP